MAIGSNGTIPAFVINLDSGTQRLERIAAALGGLGVPFQRVPAVDGRGRAAADFAEYDAGRTARFLGRHLNGPEVACYLSHMEAARRFLATGEPLGMVVEDDAGFQPDIAGLLRQFADFAAGRQCPPWHVINLGANHLRISSGIKRLGAFELRRAHLFPVTATGLLWSRAGAEALLTEGASVFAPFDGFLRRWLTRSGLGLVFSPSPVRPTGSVSQISVNPGVADRKKFSRMRLYWLRKQRRLLSDKSFALWHRLKAVF